MTVGDAWGWVPWHGLAGFLAVVVVVFLAVALAGVKSVTTAVCPMCRRRTPVRPWRPVCYWCRFALPPQYDEDV